MSIRFKEITRGSGKIYVHVEVDDSPVESVSASSHVRAGERVPCSLIKVPEVDGYVLVLAVLDVPQTASLSIAGSNGVTRESEERVFSPQEAKLKSQINTFTRNAVASQIRNADTRLSVGATHIEITDILPSDSDNIVRGIVTSDLASPGESGPAFDLRVLGPDGRDVAIRPWINMGEKVFEDPATVSGLVRKTTFSLLIPADVPSFVVWAISNDSRGPNGFLSCENFFVADKRRQGEDLFRDAEFDPRYDSWFRDLHRTSENELKRQHSWRFTYKPTFSIVLPIETGESAQKTIESTLRQTYDKFELLLVGSIASPPNSADGRIRSISCPIGTSVSSAVDLATRETTGDFVCYATPGGTLEPDVLYRYAQAIIEKPTTDFLYCDEDRFDGVHYVQPYFKSDWNPDLLMCTNYVGNLLCIRKQLLDGLSPRLPECEAAWRYDLTLRASEKAQNIYHERRILYHTQQDDDSAPNADAAVSTLQAHLNRLNINATAERSIKVPSTNVVRYRIPTENGPLVSILIPNKDLSSILERCLTSISNLSTYRNYEVVVIENGSTKPETFGLYQHIRSIDKRMRVVTYVPDAPGFSYSKVVNYGARQAKGEYLLTLNNDTEIITPDWIEQLLGPLTRPEVGAVGAKLLYPDETIQHGGASFVVRNSGPWHEGAMEPADSTHYHSLLQLSRDVPCVTGACTMTRRSLWEELGGLDEAFVVDYNDVDFCLRLREKGKLIVYNPAAVLHHYESLSRGEHWTDLQFCRDEGLMKHRWAKQYVLGDGYTNPHLFGPHRTLYLESA